MYTDLGQPPIYYYRRTTTCTYLYLKREKHIG